MKKNNFFDNVRKALSSVVKNSTESIASFAKEAIRRVAPRRVSRAPETIVEEIVEEIRAPKILSAEGGELDFSTRGDVQRIEGELSGKRKAKDIAKELGVSTQKWVSIRKKIRSGDLYGDTILERLTNARESLENTFEKFVAVEYTYTNPDGTHEQRTGEVVFFPSMERLNKQVPYGRAIKTLYTFSDAKNYWGQIGGGAEYFGIVSIGNGEYQVVDLRNPTEYNNRGHIKNGEIRAQKILKNIEHGRIQNEDE